MNQQAQAALMRVAQETGVSVAELVSPAKSWRIVRARWRVWRYLYESGWSSIEIGRLFGFDHTSVLHGMKQLGVLDRKRKKKLYPPSPGRAPKTPDEKFAQALGGATYESIQVKPSRFIYSYVNQ